MFALRVPESMAALPGRRHVCADTDDYTPEERATEYHKLEQMRDYYYRNKDQILAQSQSDQWRRDMGQYVPYPATWLRAERWDDVLTVDLPTPAKKPDRYDLANQEFERKYGGLTVAK